MDQRHGAAGGALAFGFSGYLLPWNELSYYATLVGTQIPGTVPVVGDSIVHFLRGGDQVTGDTITRFYAVHVMFLPLLIGVVTLVHVALIQMQGMSLPLGMSESDVRDQRPFFAEFLLIDACLWLILLGVIVTLAGLLPAEMGIKADPLKAAPQGIKPEWYFLFMFQTLKHVPETLGVLLFAVLGLFLVLLPLLDRPSSRGQKSSVLSWAFVALLAYAAIFEILAVLAPGVKSQPGAEAAGGAVGRRLGLAGHPVGRSGLSRVRPRATPENQHAIAAVARVSGCVSRAVRMAQARIVSSRFLVFLRGFSSLAGKLASRWCSCSPSRRGCATTVAACGA